MPNRIIKESVCTSETIDQMTWFEECFFHRLWTACDDYGRMDARPAILKAKLFPLRERLSLKDIENALQKMVDIGCVITYVCDGKPYLYLPSWEVHQSIRAKKSKYPDPDSACSCMKSSESICMQMQADDFICPRNPIQSESNPNPTTNPTRAGERAASSAVAAYLDRVNPSASPKSLELLSAYERDMGAEVCIRAIDIALDNRKANWAYINAILQRWTAEKVKCLADIDALEIRHEREKQRGGRGKYHPGAGGTVPQPEKYTPEETKRREEADREQMRKYLESLREGE